MVSAIGADTLAAISQAGPETRGKVSFNYAQYRTPRRTSAENENLKSAQNEHKNKSFYAYENVTML